MREVVGVLGMAAVLAWGLIATLRPRAFYNHVERFCSRRGVRNVYKGWVDTGIFDALVRLTGLLVLCFLAALLYGVWRDGR